MSLQSLVPPVLVDVALAASRRRIGFEGQYASWLEVMPLCKGYESEPVVKAYTAAASTAAGLGWGRVSKDATTYSSRELRLVAALQTARTIASQGRDTHENVRVVDFGGGPGTHYFLVQSMPNFDVAQYTIVESPAVATAMQKFSDEVVSWMHVSDENSLKGLGPVDIVLSSSALQYVENPFGVLRDLATMAPTVILDRLPLIDCPAHFVAKQNARYEGRGVSYPAWIFSEAAFLSELQHIGCEIMYRWEVPEDRPFLMGRRWPNQGMLLRADSARSGHGVNTLPTT